MQTASPHEICHKQVILQLLLMLILSVRQLNCLLACLAIQPIENKGQLAYK